MRRPAALHGEASALVVGQPEAPPRQLLLQDPVLLHQVLDDVLLVAVDPSREGHEQHPERLRSAVMRRYYRDSPGPGIG